MERTCASHPTLRKAPSSKSTCPHKHERPAINTEQLLRQLSEQLAKLQGGGGKDQALRWIRAQAAKTVRLIAIDDVDYFRSDAKYTIVAWRDGGKPAEAVVRTTLKELLEQLDAEQFAQVHRSVVVNLPPSPGFGAQHRRSSARIRSSSQSWLFERTRAATMLAQ